MPKTINDKPDFLVQIEGNTSTGFKSAVCRLRHDAGEEVAPVDPLTASQAAATALAGQGITLTAVQVRTVWRELLTQAIAQAKTAGGWT